MTGELVRNIRNAIRSFRRNPGASAVAIVSLAIGLGANATIFSFVNALLLRPLPVKDPGGLVEVWVHRDQSSNALMQFVPLSYPEYAHFRDHNAVFQSLAAFSGEAQRVSWIRNGEGETVNIQLISRNFFETTGLRAAAGRYFSPSRERQQAILGYGLWSRLGADPGVVGQTWNLNGHAVEIAGVAPDGFNGMLPGSHTDFWLPLDSVGITGSPADETSRQSSWLFGLGRLKPGVTREAAEANMRLLGDQFASAYPDSNRGTTGTTFPVQLIPGPFRKYVVGFTAVLLAVMTMVLLIGCANAANILLAQASGRSREMAVRAALGASRKHLIVQTLHESILLALGSGLAAYGIAKIAGPFLLSLRPTTFAVELDVAPDWRVALFVFAVSLLTGFAFGILPALRGTRFEITEAIKQGGSGSGVARSKLRSGLVIVQVAVCMVLLVAGTLCVESFRAAQNSHPGFDPENVIASTVDLGSFGYSEDSGLRFYDQMLQRAAEIPGVQAVSLTDHLPLSQTEIDEGVRVPGIMPPPGQDGWSIGTARVGAGYFRTMGTRLLRGREFGTGDRGGAPEVAVVNQAMADQFWPGKDPVGKIIETGAPRERHRLEVVGVVETGKYRTFGEPATPFFFRPFAQGYAARAVMVLRTGGANGGVVASFRTILRSMDPRLALFDTGSMRQQLEFALFTARVSGLLFGIGGGLALFLAISGLYGVIAYVMAQRRREVGIRIALGATEKNVLGLALRQALVLGGSGIVLGSFLSILVREALLGFLYGTGRGDAVSFIVAPLALMFLCVVAAYVPARGAMRLDPVQVLRSE